MSWENIVIPLASIVFGWLLNEMSKRFQLSRERRAIIGRALSNLLALHHRVRVIEECTEYLVKQLSLPESGRRAYKSSFEYVLPQEDDFVTRYEEAIDQLAETDPVTAFELRRKAVIPRLFGCISAMERLEGVSVEEVAEMEKMLKVSLMPALEKGIKELARLHGHITKWRVYNLLHSTLAVTPEMQQYLQNVQAGKHKPLDVKAYENSMEPKR